MSSFYTETVSMAQMALKFISLLDLTDDEHIMRTLTSNNARMFLRLQNHEVVSSTNYSSCQLVCDTFLPFIIFYA